MVVVQGEPPLTGSAWAVGPVPGTLHVFDSAGLRIEGPPGGIVSSQSTAGNAGITEVA
jgi:hypothetical protein